MQGGPTLLPPEPTAAVFADPPPSPPPPTPSLTTLISFHLDFCDLRGPGSIGGGGRKSVAITQGGAHHFWVFLINTEGVCQQSPRRGGSCQGASGAGWSGAR